MIKIAMTLTVSKTEAQRSVPYVYFFHLGESLGDNLLWRHHRPLQLYVELLPTILRHAGMCQTEEEIADIVRTCTWNQRAACRCGCSPGLALKYPGRHDLYVTISLTSVGVEAGETSASPPADGTDSGAAGIA